MTRCLAYALSVLLALGACSPTDPAAKAARELEDAADNRAEALEAMADAHSGQLTNQANAILANIVDPKSYDGRVAETRAEALQDEARIVEQQGDARAKAERSAGKAAADVQRAR